MVSPISSLLVGYVLKAAIRDRLIISMLVMLTLVCSMAIFMASSAMSEKGQFLTVYSSGGLRIFGVLGLVLFSVFFIRRSFDAKDVEFLLSRPISRVQLILSYSCGLSILAAVIALASSAALFFVTLKSGIDFYPFFVWSLSIVAENIVIVNAALFFSMFFTSPAIASLCVFAFYALSRMMGQFLGILNSGTGGHVNELLELAMKMISSVTPRLDLFGQTSWLVYGLGEGVNFTFVIVQCVFFIFMVLVASLIDLTLRQF